MAAGQKGQGSPRTSGTCQPRNRAAASSRWLALKSRGRSLEMVCRRAGKLLIRRGSNRGRFAEIPWKINGQPETTNLVPINPPSSRRGPNRQSGVFPTEHELQTATGRGGGLSSAASSRVPTTATGSLGGGNVRGLVGAGIASADVILNALAGHAVGTSAPTCSQQRRWSG
jgi:hypothetical protein